MSLVLTATLKNNRVLSERKNNCKKDDATTHSDWGGWVECTSQFIVRNIGQKSKEIEHQARMLSQENGENEENEKNTKGEKTDHNKSFLLR